MMSISMIAPAFAANPWKDLWSCATACGDPVFGSEYKLISLCEEMDPESQTCQTDVVRETCTIKRGAEGHYEFKDLNPYDGEFQDGEEQKRCHKNSFWT